MAGGEEYVRSRCPTCGQHAKRRVYDIGSGRELSCATCEWCWGADGQDLKPIEIGVVRDMFDVRKKVRDG